MRSRRTATLLVAGLVLGLVVAACGGGGGNSGGELSLEQYFDQVTSTFVDLEERTANLNQPLDQEFESDVEQIDAARGAFTSVLPFFRDFIADLDELTPPEEAADAHRDLVAGFAGLVGGLDDLIDQLADIDSAAEFSALLFDLDSPFGSAIQQLESVCLELQTIADDNAIEADLLDCEG